MKMNPLLHYHPVFSIARVIISLFLLSFLATGCTSHRYGNFVSLGNQEVLAQESVQLLIKQYPPAKTHFALQQATNDIFGQTLVKELRQKGYALTEFNAEKVNNQLPQSMVPLGYVVDHVESNLYRVVLWVEHQTFIRAYREAHGMFSPLGAWVINTGND